MSTRWRPRLIAFNSLLGRFVFASLLLLPLFIFLSGLLISNAFQHSQIKAENEKLQTLIYLLLNLSEVENKKIILPESLTEPKFNTQNSGLYGFIYDTKGNEQWRSNSSLLISQSLFNPSNNFITGNTSLDVISLDDNQLLNTLSYDIEWLDDDDKILKFRFIVASNNKALNIELKAYQKRLWQWLSLMGVLIITAQIIILKWGLRPLKHLSIELSDIQKNKINQLSKTYPLEIQPVTKNFNSILLSEKQQRERYRNTMTDLAHSLKTPLAVIQSQIDDKQESTHNLKEQIDRINQIITHQLKRAVIRTKQNSVLNQSEKIVIHTLINRLIKILEKVYIDRNIRFNNRVPDNITFFGDEADLLEVLGNLLDNACKHGHNEVTITGIISKKNDQNMLSICISDNGNGVPDALKTTILARGSRGDTIQVGQGIGLSVAADIMSSYGGSLEVNNNQAHPHLNGACFCIHFPIQ